MTGHGGNIYFASRELGIAEKKLIDFSASINPFGVPVNVISEIRKNARHLFNYPDPDVKRLRHQIADYYGIEPETTLCGNGSTELIYLIPRVLKPKKVLIPAPTFSEYERACRISSKVKVKRLKLKRKDAFKINTDEFIKSMKGCDMVFLCNPNNPTGRLLKKKEILKIADAAKKLKCYLIVDEAFIDFCPGNTVITEVKYNPYLIVLRSLTKFYALSGLRIGYGVFPEYMIPLVKEYKEPWTVNSLAQRAGFIALGDTGYRDKTFRVIKTEKRFLEKSFKKLGIEFLDSDANFYLLRSSKTTDIYQELRKKGILVRDCSNFKGLDNSYIRVAVKSRADNVLLIKELTNIVKGGGEKT